MESIEEIAQLHISLHNKSVNFVLIYFHSCPLGILGLWMKKGYVRIAGRSKDTIIRGGENVYPAEIENVLHTNPSVVEAYVVGVPDKRLGEEICCWVKVRGDVTAAELQNFCKSQVSVYAINQVTDHWMPSHYDT